MLNNARYGANMTGARPLRSSRTLGDLPNPVGAARGGQVRGYAAGGMPDLGPGFSFGNIKTYTGTQAEENAAMAANKAAGSRTVGNVASQPDNIASQSANNFGQFADPVSGINQLSNQATTSLNTLSEFNNSNQQLSATGNNNAGNNNAGAGKTTVGFGGGNSGGINGTGGPFPLEGQYGIIKMMRGGLADLGGYSDGGRMLKGPGDGMSDSIPGIIGRKQPARLADGEFVVPADVVSHLGNGSTDAGAKRLYAMMAKVRTARTGKKKQAPAVNADKILSRVA
jgi:hypothetical protein